MTNAIYKEARVLNQEKWTIHFDEYTSVNLSRYKIPQSMYSVVFAYHMLNCESAFESWKLSQSIATSNRTQRTATVIPFRSVAIRVAIRYTLRVRIRTHTRTPSEVHSMKLITKVHRTGYFGNTRASVCLNSFSNAKHRVSTTPILRTARIVCAHPFYFVSLLRSSLVPSSLFEDKRERTRRASRTLSIEKFYFFFRVD